MRLKRTYAVAVDFEEEEDGRWGVDIPTVPVCAAWGYTRNEALEALQDLTQAYFEVLLEYNDPLPEDIDSYAVPLGTENVSGNPVVIVSK